jgi:hypothetical protein
MADEESVPEKKGKKEENRIGFTEEDKVAYKRLEMQYGSLGVEDTVRVVREEMHLSVDDTEVEVARRLREKSEREQRKTAEDVIEKATRERETILREKTAEAKEEVKRKEAERLKEKMESDEKKG